MENSHVIKFVIKHNRLLLRLHILLHNKILHKSKINSFLYVHVREMSIEIKNIGEILFAKYRGSDGEIIQCDTKRLTAPGENYGSVMTAIDIKIRNKDTDTENTLHIVGKSVPLNEFTQKLFKTPLTFRKELEFYRTIVPTLQDFQTKNGIEKVLDLFPEFYGGRLGLNLSGEFDNDAVILLENLKIKGYFCADRTKGFNINEAKYILRNLAKFHAVPLALKLKKPVIFKNKVLPHLNFVGVFDNFEDNIFEAVIDNLMSVVEENEECRPMLANMKEKLLASANCVKNPKEPREPFSTIAHNDFWVNNIMIKTKEGKLVGNKFVDFQIPEYHPPAKDLMFFIFVSIQNEVVVNYYEELIELYHRSFVDTLKQFDVDTEPFSLGALEEEIDLEMKDFVLFQCFYMLRPIFAPRDMAVDAEEMSEENIKKPLVAPQEMKEKLWMLVKEFGKRRWL